MKTSKRSAALITILMILATVGCDELNRDPGPVELIATVAQEIQIVDLVDDACGNLGTIQLQAITKRADVSDPTFLDVRLERMRVSYVRTDGGSLVPEAFNQTISGILTVNAGAQQLNDFVVFQPGAFVQAPFAALIPTNGGIDPDTGKSTVSMDVIVDIFGETLAGENVSTRVRFPLTFCYSCGGCA